MTRNMTTGNIEKHLISFAVPMILGNMFQLTYNAVDSIIVGRYVGEKALAAVGTANPIMNIIIFFIIGICMGASVLMSEFFGAGELEKLKREISTTIIIGSIFAIVVSIICIFLAKPILSLIQTPEEILNEATHYLKIIFSGLIFTFIYNVYASTMRSMGDAKTPILFLMISSVTNVILDLIFVAVLHMGVAGAAYATVIAEALSGVLCVFYAYKKIPILQLTRKDFVIERAFVGKTISYSWVTSMQQTCLYVGKVFVQGAVNPLGVDSIATFNAVNRVDDFAFTPEQSIAHSMTTFIAQNRGAKQDDRIHKCLNRGLLLETAYWALLAGIIYFGASGMMRLFVPKGDAAVVRLGSEYLRYMTFFYLLPAYTNGLQGYFRGMGKLKVTLNATFIQMLFRVLLSYLFAPAMGIKGIAFACFGGWVAMLMYEIPVYFMFRKKEMR